MRVECFLLKAAELTEAIIGTSRETWLCSLSETCARLMTSLSALIYSAVCLLASYTAKSVDNICYVREFCFIMVCVFLVDCLQYRQFWLSWTSSLPSILSEVHPEPGVDAYLPDLHQEHRIIFTLDVFVM